MFVPDRSSTSEGIGDVRDLGTTNALGKQRMCVNIDANRSRVPVPCEVVHDEEKVAFMVLDVEGRPKDMNTWKDSDGAAYDAACTAVTEALMGGTHPEVEILADSDFDAAPSHAVRGGTKSVRLFSCNVKNPADTGHLPAGTVVGLGSKTLPI